MTIPGDSDRKLQILKLWLDELYASYLCDAPFEHSKIAGRKSICRLCSAGSICKEHLHRVSPRRQTILSLLSHSNRPESNRNLIRFASSALIRQSEPLQWNRNNRIAFRSAWLSGSVQGKGDGHSTSKRRKLHSHVQDCKPTSFRLKVSVNFSF